MSLILQHMDDIFTTFPFFKKTNTFTVFTLKTKAILSFLDFKIRHTKNGFTSSVFSKATFSYVFTDFDRIYSSTSVVKVARRSLKGQMCQCLCDSLFPTSQPFCSCLQVLVIFHLHLSCWKVIKYFLVQNKYSLPALNF